MDDNKPVLITKKPLKPEFEKLKEIVLTCNNFTLGRGLNNSAVVPFISISRNHCIFKKEDTDWLIEDNSSFGITINGNKLGKGKQSKLNHEDIIVLEPSEEFVYQFVNQSDIFEIPRKRIKLEKPDGEDIINDVKFTFEQSQSYEIKHIENKIQNAKSMQETSRILKEQLELVMERRIKQLDDNYAGQIENLIGEKTDVENQKKILIAEKNVQIASIKEEMEGKIAELQDQIQKHNETESELLQENNNLKEKLLKEREEFLSELNRESSSKQEMLDKLKAKMKEQEEIRLKEKDELELMLKNEVEQIKLAKEKELKELEELKQKREKELEQELADIRKNLELKVQQAEENRQKAEQMLSEQVEQRKKLTDEEKVKREQLMQEREEIQKKLTEAECSAEKSIEELKARVQERETELAALAADRIQKQADQSSEVISSLQEQLEKVKSQLESVESEKKNLLESLGTSESAGASSTKHSTLAEVGELMESELQCSICAELFVAATTLSCSHTFCKYCITMWKKKKKDCPICRTNITSECKSLVLDSFIEKMVQNLTEEMKTKRQEMLKSREELESALARQQSVRTSRGSFGFDESDYDSASEYEEGEEEEYYEDYSDTYHAIWSDTDSGSDGDGDGDDSDERAGEAAGGAPGAERAGAGAGGHRAPAAELAHAAAGGHARPGAPLPDSAERRAGRNGGGGGIPGAYYGGYGRCYRCGARGHWAPGCPY
ncbi:E3 ubiquitin-protein ligase rnf8-A-like isoform X1 [Ostrinia furnacalis]|uniref:E3 ubiquitin-protein ligase rnf8-A-like isoform X1 n=1 Tax=Ostrinia furnacalis TaxID=93504 RepID=UPI001038E822|nr:E3 ubiquitin-protein ligase rnf8-A-like isoform X1 [Ostrinia furnacalis]